ncbi:MAG: DUF6265 family protein [Bacteroidales bacterium]|jgi:hypothetical protein|nr:DUF6265 family protein [Bacteroidales bacterium]
MRKNRKLFKFLGFVIGLLLTACTAPNPTETIYKLAGDWKTTKGPAMYESWKIDTDSTLVGLAFSINGSDTLMIEKMQLNHTADSLVYKVNVGSQKTVSFGLAKATKNSWIFENKAHDYPNRIIYKMINDSILHARTENSAGNKVIEFYFKKIR